MKWNVVTPFAGPPGRWIDDFVPAGQHSFNKIAFGQHASRADWHQRLTRGTPLSGWWDYWTTAGRGLQGGEGAITVFPQLAVTLAMRRRLTVRRHMPIVAWCFNIGRFPGGARRQAAQLALQEVERFVVHSTGEIALIADYLDIARERVTFVPLQRADIVIEAQEEAEAPFLVAMGSANRDYATLVEAARQTRLPVTIVSSPRAMQGISVPDNVTVVSGLTHHDCLLLAQRARASIVPLADVGAASGQVTVLEAQRMQRPVIATRSIGTVDYIDHDRSGLLVEHGDVDAMAGAMQSLWDDKARRDRLAVQGAEFAQIHASDEAAGRALGRILDEVAAQGRS
jgi:glycosyltransferase involved in cell wall biosynthesis